MGACVDAALGMWRHRLLVRLWRGVLIHEASDQPPATGLTDAVEWVKVKMSEAVEFTKEKVIPKVVAKVEEIQANSKK